MSTVLYREQRTLARRGPTDQLEDEEIAGLLVGEKAVMNYQANYSQYGSNSVYIYPAFYKGERCWLSKEIWQPAYGYSAYGTSEFIMTFEDGVKIFLERGVFKFNLPKDVEVV